MSSYIDLPIDSDPQDVLQDAYDYLQSVIPGWTPAVGNLDVWLLMALAASAAELRAVASAVPKGIFRWYGANLIGLTPIDATQATTTTTWTALDTNGYTIPAGTQVSIDRPGDTPVAFETVADAIIPIGSSSVVGVLIQAIDAGAASSGLGSIGGAVSLEDPLTFVSGITMQAVTSGGQDAESDDDYLNRLVGQLQLLAPRPILPADFDAFATNIAGVTRAVAIDGYNPVDLTSGNPRMVAIALVDALGNPVSSTVKAAVQADLQGRREVNFVVNVIDPTYTTIDVNFTVKIIAGFTGTDVVNNVIAAIQGFLNPANWGIVEGNTTSWTNLTVVRFNKLVQLIENVDGVDYIPPGALTLGIHGGTLAAADVNLAGAAPLPLAGTVTGAFS